MLIIDNLDRILGQLTRKDAHGNVVVPELVGKGPADLRLIHYAQEFNLPPGGTFAAPVAQGPNPVNFAGGAIIVGINAGAIPEGQPDNPFLTGTERFEFQIDYTQGDKLMAGASGGWMLGSTMFGRNGERGLFNEKVLYMPAQQNLFVQVRTRLPERLFVTFTYASLVWRFAQ